jgi:hypothetical protein
MVVGLGPQMTTRRVQDAPEIGEHADARLVTALGKTGAG